MLQFQLFWMYVASVSSRYCKSRSIVAHVVVGPICNSHRLQLLGLLACVGVEGAPRCERKPRCGHRTQVWHEPPREAGAAGAGIQMLAPCPSARCSVNNVV
jgi:hypothetical protein